MDVPTVLDRYELLELIGQDEERKSFKARDISDSRDVIVHVLRSQELAGIARLLFSRGQVAGGLFAGEREGAYYVVTEFLTECHDVRKWLQQQSGVNSTSKSSVDPLSRAGPWKVPQTEMPALSTPGEFTRLFQTGSPNPESQPMVQPLPETKAGEFTRMFSSVPASSEPVVPEPTPVAEEPPGDFTRVFQAHPEVFESSPLAPRSEGQFTQLFRTPSPSEVTEGAKTGPGELTRLFASPTEPARLKDGTVNTGPPQASGEAATGIFASPSAAEPVAVVPQSAGPSDFTRVIAIPASPAEPPRTEPPASQIPSEATPSAPAPAATTSYLVPVLVLNGLFILAVLLVLYFALKK